MEPSSSDSFCREVNDLDSHEWLHMDPQQRMELLNVKRLELEEFENEVRSYMDTHDWNESYMERATKDLHYHLRVIDKLEQSLK